LEKQKSVKEEDYKRKLELENIILENQIDTIKSEIFQNESQVSLLQAQIDSLVIKAPADGTVIEIDVMLGGEVIQEHQWLGFKQNRQKIPCSPSMDLSQ